MLSLNTQVESYKTKMAIPLLIFFKATQVVESGYSKLRSNWTDHIIIIFPKIL